MLLYRAFSNTISLQTLRKKGEKKNEAKSRSREEEEEQTRTLPREDARKSQKKKFDARIALHFLVVQRIV
jgi:hypothetical protein